jgi:hypothetical protein
LAATPLLRLCFSSSAWACSTASCLASSLSSSSWVKVAQAMHALPELQPPRARRRAALMSPLQHPPPALPPQPPVVPHLPPTPQPSPCGPTCSRHSSCGRRPADGSGPLVARRRPGLCYPHPTRQSYRAHQRRPPCQRRPLSEGLVWSPPWRV